MSFLDDSSYQSIAIQNDMDSTLYELLKIEHPSKFVATMTLNRIKNMDGKRYISSGGSVDYKSLSESNFILTEAKSTMRTICNYINSPITSLDYIKTLLIILMNNGFLYSNYNLLDIRQDLYAYDTVSIQDLVINFYKTRTETMKEMFNELFTKYPQITEPPFSKNEAYFTKEIGGDASNIANMLIKALGQEVGIGVYYNIIMSDIKPYYRQTINPTLDDLVKLFNISNYKYKSTKSIIYKILDNLLTIDDYNDLLMQRHLSSNINSEVN